MATTLINNTEKAAADAAIARLALADRVDGRYQQVIRRAMSEDVTFFEEVRVHDGPDGNGRTICVEKKVGTKWVRKTQGDLPYGVTRDWYEINLANLV